jgi:mono/diheme cytochrome c family protein
MLAGSIVFASRLLSLALLCLCLTPLAVWAQSSTGRTSQVNPDPVQRGAYLFALAGCGGCHTDEAHHGPALGGGVALDTPFGTFFGPNISPDSVNGIGSWNDADFVRALREGIRPDGGHLFPAFPYPSFTFMTDADMLDIKAYIFAQPPVSQPSKEHDVWFPFSWRWLQTFWRWMNFTEGPFQPDATKSPAWNRGAYLAEGVLHCGECHTPRGMTGGLETDVAYSGTTNGPGGGKVPNITTDKETGIGRWSHYQIVHFLKSGILPDGDAAGSLMGEVIRRSTSQMTDTDRDAVATYLEGLPAISNPDAKAVQPGFD